MGRYEEKGVRNKQKPHLCRSRLGGLLRRDAASGKSGAFVILSRLRFNTDGPSRTKSRSGKGDSPLFRSGTKNS